MYNKIKVQWPTSKLTTTLQPFNGLFPRTTWVSQYQKDKTSRFKWCKRWWGFGMQWHQLDHIQTICTSLQTDNHTNTSSLNFYRPDALPDAQPTVSKHWRQLTKTKTKIILITKITLTLTHTGLSCCSYVHLSNIQTRGLAAVKAYTGHHYWWSLNQNAFSTHCLYCVQTAEWTARHYVCTWLSKVIHVGVCINRN